MQTMRGGRMNSRAKARVEAMDVLAVMAALASIWMVVPPTVSTTRRHFELNEWLIVAPSILCRTP